MTPFDDKLRAAAARRRDREAEAKRRAEAEAKKAEASRKAEAKGKKAEARARKAEAEGASGAEAEGIGEADAKKKRKATDEAETAEADRSGKRRRSLSPRPQPIHKPLEVAAPIDLTAETPPEEERVGTPPSPIAPEAEALVAAADLGTTVTPPADEPDAEGHDAAGPSERASTPVEAGGEGGEAHTFTLQSIAERGKWVEEIMSRVCMPEVQRDFLSHGSATFFRDVYASTFWMANSVATLKAWFTQASVAMDATRNEAEAAQARAEEAEKMLEEARAAEMKAKEALGEAERQRALDAKKIESTEMRLQWAEAEIRSQQ